jgi:hypothetical protein
MILEALAAVMSLSSEGEIANSPFIVPVAGCAMIAAIVGFNAWSSARKRQIESEERLAAIARGVPIPPTEAEIALTRNRPSLDSVRRRDNVRRGGIILISTAVGIMLFFFALTVILRTPAILSGVACGLIPLGIGVGLLIDARIQTRDIELLKFESTSASSTDLVR